MPNELDVTTPFIYLKMIGVGLSTLAVSGGDFKEILNLLSAQAGYCIMGTNLREHLHEIVDHFCDLQDGKYESKI